MDEAPVSPASPIMSHRGASILSRIARFRRMTRRMELKLRRSWPQVSNKDHLFQRDARIMILETSTSSLFQIFWAKSVI